MALPTLSEDSCAAETMTDVHCNTEFTPSISTSSVPRRRSKRLCTAPGDLLAPKQSWQTNRVSLKPDDTGESLGSRSKRQIVSRQCTLSDGKAELDLELPVVDAKWEHAVGTGRSSLSVTVRLPISSPHRDSSSSRKSSNASSPQLKSPERVSCDSPRELTLQCELTDSRSDTWARPSPLAPDLPPPTSLASGGNRSLEDDFTSSLDTGKWQRASNGQCIPCPLPCEATALLKAFSAAPPGATLRDMLQKEDLGDLSVQSLLQAASQWAGDFGDEPPDIPEDDNEDGSSEGSDYQLQENVTNRSITEQLNIDEHLVQDVLKQLILLNSGLQLRHCACQPGGPHTCMSPNVSALASQVASLQHSLAHTMSNSLAQTVQNSRRGSGSGLRDKRSSRGSGSGLRDSITVPPATVVKPCSAADAGAGG